MIQLIISIRETAACNMMSLAFVPMKDIPRVFDIFYNEISDEVIEVVKIALKS